MVKIFLFAHDPGGANVIFPLEKPLEEKDYQVRLFGKGPALEKYRQFDKKGLKLNQTRKTDIKLWLKQEKPDLIITGTSNKDKTENKIWSIASTLKIPSFAVLDYWSNYRKRFINLPTKILVMDEFAKKQMLNDGFKKEKIIVTGHPYFEFIRREKEFFLKTKKPKNKQDFENFDNVITFVSEPISQARTSTVLGYTEKLTLINLYQALSKISSIYNKKIYLIIKLHPYEKKDNYSSVIKEFKANLIKIKIEYNSHPWDLILVSDLVCGMTSMFLIESVLLGKPVLRIQLGSKKKDKLFRLGIGKRILNKKTLLHELKNIIVKSKLPRYNLKIIKNPIDNILEAVENYLKKYYGKTCH